MAPAPRAGGAVPGLAPPRRLRARPCGRAEAPLAEAAAGGAAPGPLLLRAAAVRRGHRGPGALGAPRGRVRWSRRGNGKGQARLCSEPPLGRESCRACGSGGAVQLPHRGLFKVRSGNGSADPAEERRLRKRSSGANKCARLPRLAGLPLGQTACELLSPLRIPEIRLVSNKRRLSATHLWCFPAPL